MLRKLRSLKYNLLQLIKDGMTPREAGLALAVALILGTFPVLASTTFLCLAAGHLLRLNHILLQTMNYLLYPVQLILIVPLISLGRTVLGKPPFPYTSDQMIAMLKAEPIQFITEMALQQLYGVLAWSLLVIPISIPAYLLLKRYTRRLAERSPDAVPDR